MRDNGPRQEIAALFVVTGGVYFDQPGIDPWDEARDARLYCGPHSVIAHPPCERWGRYWSGGPSAKVRRIKGDDKGCFQSALASVRNYGGVLEHPEASHAWAHHGLVKPPRNGGWVKCDMGWTCCVEQGHYGHLARKMTWLYYVGPNPPPLIWGSSGQRLRMDYGYHSAEERKRASVNRPAALRLADRLAERVAARMLERAKLVPVTRGHRILVDVDGRRETVALDRLASLMHGNHPPRASRAPRSPTRTPRAGRPGARTLDHPSSRPRRRSAKRSRARR